MLSSTSDTSSSHNEQIRIPKVQVIDENGEHLGEMDTGRALTLAKEKGLDLVEIAPNVRPPVCKICDYGKYKYERMKKGRKQKAKSKMFLTGFNVPR